VGFSDDVCWAFVVESRNDGSVSEINQVGEKIGVLLTCLTWLADAVIETFSLGVEPILVVAPATTPDERSTLVGRRLEAPFVDEIGAVAGIAGPSAFVCK
jgi:hypothetical protein